MDQNIPALRSLSVSDIEEMVKIHRECFPQSRSTKLGNHFLRKMYHWYIMFHPQLAYGVDLNGKLSGFIVGSLGNTANERTRYLIKEIILGFARTPRLLFNRKMFNSWQSFARGLLPINSHRRQSGFPTSIEKKHYFKATVDSIAVTSSARGKSLGKSLMVVLEQAAISQGATLLVLGVEHDNVQARTLYEKCGWVLIYENASDNSANYVKHLGLD